MTTSRNRSGANYPEPSGELAARRQLTAASDHRYWRYVIAANQWLASCERLLAILLLAVLLITMGTQVIARYLFAAPFSWSEELARLAMIWLTFVAAALVMAKGGHITVDLWSGRVGRTAHRWLSGLAGAVVLFTCLWLLVGGGRFVWFVHPVASPALGVPKSWWYLAVSAGLLLMAIHSLIGLLLVMRGSSLSEQAMATPATSPTRETSERSGSELSRRLEPPT